MAENNENKIPKEDEEEKERKQKLKDAFDKITDDNLKMKCLSLNKLNDEMRDKYSKDYKNQNLEIELGEQKVFLDYLNKIREVINTQKDISLFVDDKDEEKYTINSNDSKNFEKIKNFWKTAIVNAKFFDMNENDKNILEYLQDVCYIPLEYPSFRVEFNFEQNDYMEETKLTKTFYFLDQDKDSLDKSEGTEIHWNGDDKNPTKKLTKKTKKKGKVKETVTVTKDIESFFNIFDTKDSDLDKELVEAHFFRNDLLENMLEYYLNIMEIHYDEKDEDEEEEVE